MIIVDSSVWIDYFNGAVNRETEMLHDILGRQLIGILDLIYIEVLQGFAKDKDFKVAKRLFSSLTFFDSSGQDLAEETIQHYRHLRKSGVTVRKTIDVIIASFCIRNGFTLLHRDKDYLPMKTYLKLKTL